MDDHADVLILGAGTSGLFCARGLAGTARVTLVDGGADPGPVDAGVLRHLHRFDGIDWGYVEHDRGYPLARGRIVGGCSTINASAGVRGQPTCFAGWGPGWSWDDVLPAFRAIERDVQFGDAEYHGDAGPIRMTRLPQGAVDEAFAAACRAAGHADCPDHNAPGAFGVGPWPTNRDEEGGRMGTLAAVMPGLRSRVPLRQGVVVRRVIVEDARVTGVEIAGAGGEEILRADRVVLSCGAFGTPEILLRSGIGPAADLEREGIPVVHDLPGVGGNLQDHPWALLRPRAADAEALAARPVSGGLLRYALGGDPADEAQIFPFSSHLYEPDAPWDEVSMCASIMGPRSRGRVWLEDGRLRVRLAHLSDPGDMERMCEVVGHAADIVDAMAADGVLTVPEGAWWREPDLAAAVDRVVGTYNHPVGTCPIGADPSMGAVVGPDLAVHGIAGLSIADASVMPVIPRSNTNLTCMMIGVRAAEILCRS